MLRLRSVSIGLAGWLVFAAGAAHGQLPATQVTTLFPPGAQAGTEVEVQLGGADLDDLTGLECSEPGIQARAIEVGVDEFGVPLAGPTNRFAVSVAPDVAPGRYELRANGRFGLSNPVVFEVGELPELVEAGGTASAAGAMPVAVGSVVNGRADDNGVDHYAVELEAGQWIDVVCRAEVFDSQMDPVIEVIAPSGELVASANDWRGRDALLGYQAAVAGRHLVRVYDLHFEGGAAYPYRLRIGNGQAVASVYPAVVEGGAASEMTVVLADGSRVREKVAMSGQETVPGEGTQTGAGMAWRAFEGLPVALSKVPVVAERESNGDWEAAMPLEVPAVVAGERGSGGDRDCYRFDAKKGEEWWIEVSGDRLGAAADFVVTVYSLVRGEDGILTAKRLAENDDIGMGVGIGEISRLSRDPVLKFVAPGDGAFGVMVWDQFGAGERAQGYALQVRRPTPGFRLLASVGPPIRDAKKIGLRPAVMRSGGGLLVDVWVDRVDGFGGEVQLSLEGLPDGLSCAGGVIAAGAKQGRLLVQDEKGEAWSGSVVVVGTSESGGQSVREEASVHVPSWTIGDPARERYRSRYAGALALSVVGGEREPVEMAIEVPEQVELELGGTLEIPVKLTMSGELKGEFKIRPEGLAGMAKPPELKLKKDQAEGKLALACAVTKENKLAAGTWRVFLRGEGQVGGYRPAADRVAHWEGEKQRMDGLVAELEGAVKKLEAEAATEAALGEAKGKRDRAVAARKRVEGFLKTANDRAKPRDVKVAAYSRSFLLTLKAPEKKEETKS